MARKSFVNDLQTSLPSTPIYHDLLVGGRDFRPQRYRKPGGGKRLVRNPDDLQNGSLKRQSVSSDEGGWGPAPHTLTSQNTKVRPEAMLSQARQIRHQPTPAGAFSDLGSVVSQQQRARHQASLERKAAAARVSPQRQTSALGERARHASPASLRRGWGALAPHHGTLRRKANIH